MNFSFYCTVNDIETGLQITEPLKKLSPMMWPAIRLSPDPDNRVLKEVARMAALQLMGKDEDYKTTIYAWLHTSYAHLFNPLYQQLKDTALKKFHVFLCWFLDYEAAVEREVIGPGYQRGVEGKPQWRERNPWYPHVQGMLNPWNRLGQQGVS
ncbi:hypothetical protein OEA41_010599 [Lepraria neglecta]|uniref:Uncharacterized protein n=1 Tax=Lepraria neglecta TaxID=209136 RepID=A0AAE0DE02_9LECA|nr:hypothetical protein OEA41_010599 [Lepraria neglecta]